MSYLLGITHRNRLLRDCLATALSRGRQYEVVSLDHTLPDCLDAFRQRRADAILVDLGLPDGLALELTRQVRAEAPETKLIILSHGHLQEQLIECMAAGAHGCLLEEASLKDVAAAVERVLAGETFCSPEIVQPIFHRLAETAQQAEWHQRSQAAELTPRELEILQLIAGRLSNKQIARRLSLSLYTIKNHIHNLLEKLRVEDRHEAVDYARHQQWIK